MRAGKKRRIFGRGIAGVLAASLLFGVVGNHADGLAITAQAAENEPVLANTVMDGGEVISLGEDHSAAIKADGSLWTWGLDGEGQLGGVVLGAWYSSKPINIMRDVTAVSLGWWHSAALKTDGSLWTWGANGRSQLGHTGDNYKPIKIMEDVKAVSLGEIHSAALKTDGSLWTWGANDNGQLGNGTTEDSDEPIKIMEDVKAVSLGEMHSAAIKTDGSLWTWGANGLGQLGNGTKEDSSEPIKIMEDVKAVSLGERHSAAIKTDGSLWTWGTNGWGQLGNGTTERSYEPIKIMEDVKAVSLGWQHSAAIKTDGSLWTWGDNYCGQLGDGTRGESHEPIKIMEDVKAVSLGEMHSAAVKTDGSLWMWGKNNYGQLGNGTTENSYVPIQIMLSESTSPNPDGPDPDDPDPDDPDPDDPDAIFIDKSLGPVIKVVDAAGKPIAGATVYYGPVASYTTSAKGMVTLENYQTGLDVVIAKKGYVNKTIRPFVKDKSGISTYTLSGDKTGGGAEDDITKKLGDLADGVWLLTDQEQVNLLTKEAQLNLKYKNKISSEYSIVCKMHDKYEEYALYSGANPLEAVAYSTTGVFSNKHLQSLTADAPVYLEFREGNRWLPRKKLNLHVVDTSPAPEVFAIGDNVEVAIPQGIPMIGGDTLTLDIPDLPIRWNYRTDGTIEGGIGIGEDSDLINVESGKSLHDFISDLKKGNKAAAVRSMIKKNAGKLNGGLKAEFACLGYVETNVKNPDYLQGKLYVAVSLEASWETSLPPVPFILVEVSVKGELNADGSIKWSVQDKLEGSVGVGGEVGLGVGAGVGIPKAASIGVYGEGAVGLHYVIIPEDNRGLDEFYISGEVGVKAKILGGTHELSLLEGRYDIIGSPVSTSADGQSGYGAFVLDDYDAYESIDRGYLTADGTMAQWTADGGTYADGNTNETTLQSAAYFGTVPEVVRMGDTVMLFYLTDAGAGRDAADRDMLVYSLWDAAGQNWSGPKAVLDDNTADYSPDLYTDGEKIYAVWQDAAESLAGLSVEESAKCFVLHAAVYDAQQKQFVDLGKIESENGLFQQSPQILADDGGVSVYWYENAQDNVLGLSGTNRIYRACLTDQDVLTKGIQVMSVSEEDPAETEDGMPEPEESETDEPEEETPGAEDTVSAFRQFVALTEEEDVPETAPSAEEEEGKEENPGAGEEEPAEGEKSEQESSDVVDEV